MISTMYFVYKFKATRQHRARDNDYFEILSEIIYIIIRYRRNIFSVFYYYIPYYDSRFIQLALSDRGVLQNLNLTVNSQSSF